MKHPSLQVCRNLAETTGYPPFAVSRGPMVPFRFIRETGSPGPLASTLRRWTVDHITNPNWRMGSWQTPSMANHCRRGLTGVRLRSPSGITPGIRRGPHTVTEISVAAKSVVIFTLEGLSQSPPRPILPQADHGSRGHRYRLCTKTRMHISPGFIYNRAYSTCEWDVATLGFVYEN